MPTPSSDLPDSDQNKLKTLLFLLDKFCVGDEVYHELTMQSGDLPKSYLVKQLRTDLNKTYHIERTLGKYPGAKLDFTCTLAAHIKDLIQQKPELRDGVVEVKLSGDGARMSRSTNFMIMSFALLQCNEKVMSSKSNRTVAIINGPENYETLKQSLSNLFTEINGLIKTGTILIDGEHVKLDFFLGGDMNFLLMIMGLSGASSDHACLWCKVHNSNRWDTSKDMNFYTVDPNFKRTLADIKDCSELKCFSCINQPLIDIALDHVVPDELHLLLRVTDRLLENVIDEVLERDVKQDFNRRKGQPKGLILANLVKGINYCGISFNVWYKKNADGSTQLTQLRFKNVVETLDLRYMNVLGQRCDNENL